MTRTQARVFLATLAITVLAAVAASVWLHGTNPPSIIAWVLYPAIWGGALAIPSGVAKAIQDSTNEQNLAEIARNTRDRSVR